jgi:hypothetical protein
MYLLNFSDISSPDLPRNASMIPQIRNIPNAIKNTLNRILNGIHSGDVIHHQLQSILFVNFNVINIKNKIAGNPNPFSTFFILTNFSVH